MSGSHDQELRLGLIGAGPWGRNFIKTIKGLPGFKLTALASRNPASRDLVDSECWITPDWQELLASDKIDGVIIATPPKTHFEILKAALKHKLPAIVEKPLTMDVAEAEELSALVEASGVPVLVDHVCLYNPAYEALKARAAQEGKIMRIESVGGNHGPFRDDVPALWDYGPHDLSMCFDLMGSIPAKIKMTVNASGRDERAALDGNFVVEAQFSDGVEAKMMFGNLMEKKVRVFNVHFKNGKQLVFDDLSTNKLVLKGQSQGDETIFIENDYSPLQNLLIKFRNRIENGHPASDIRLGTQIVRVIDGILRQANAGI